MYYYSLKNNTSKCFEAQSLNKTTTFKTCASGICRNDAHATDTPNNINLINDTYLIISWLCSQSTLHLNAKHT